MNIKIKEDSEECVIRWEKRWNTYIKEDSEECVIGWEKR
jgi:hypothetical protein